ncbi:MAG TPA: hypothetical protein VJJ55_01615 [Candidatus Paceibacterota bacterium]
MRSPVRRFPVVLVALAVAFALIAVFSFISTLKTALSGLIGIAVIAVSLGIVAAIVVFFWQGGATRVAAMAAKAGATIGGATGKATAFAPASLLWLAIGWLVMLPSLYNLLPSWWSWFWSNQALFWMTPFCLAAIGLLWSTQKRGAMLMATLICLIYGTAFWKALPFGASAASTQQSVVARVPPPLARFERCTPLPRATPKKGATVTETLYGPVGTESPCYVIQMGYNFRYSPKAPIQIRWQNGQVQHLVPDPTQFVDHGSNLRNAAFFLSSLGGTPAPIVWAFEKKE